ncbi:hypothetical protein WIX39_007975 [Variovorax sp. AB1(2024)]|uniref:hypothetical protein n=1 Tax=Variovorax sp. AB1(2024) TaxID=3132214 RepID=UPI0030A0F8DA
MNFDSFSFLMPSQISPGRRSFFFFILILVVLATIHVTFYLNGEHHLYVNDYRNYWIAYWKSGLQFKQSAWEWARALREGIWASDYNSLPAALLLPFSLAMGYERYGYILGAALTYLIPVVVLSGKAASLVVRDSVSDTRPFYIFAIAAACFVPFWVPTLRGYVDIVGLIPFALAFILVRTAGFGLRIRPGLAILLGLAIWMPFLFRRWYAFSVVAFVLTAPIYCIVRACIDSHVRWTRATRNTTINFAIAGIFSVGACLLAQGGLVKTILQTSYSSIYVAYQRSTFDHFMDLWRSFGGLYLLLAVAGLNFLWKTPSKRIDVSFIAANAILLFVLFTRTQGFGMHHYLPLAFWIYLLMCVGLWSVLLLFSAPFGWKISVVTVASLLILAATFYRSGIGAAMGGAVLPSVVYNNKIGDEVAYRSLALQLDKLVKPDEKWTAFASDVILNRDVLLSVSNELLADRAVDTSHVDLIQMLSVAPFMARYAVVSDPVLTHLPQGTQTVITIPARSILEGKGIGAAYKRVGPIFQITDSVKALVYEKTRPFTRVEVDEMLAEFFARYPEWRAVYENEIFKLAMTATTKVGDQWGKFEFEPKGLISIHPGETKPTIASFTGMSKKLSLSVAPACPGSDGVDVLLRSDGHDLVHLVVEPGETVTLPTTNLTINYELTVSKRANAWCDLVSVTLAN